MNNLPEPFLQSVARVYVEHESARLLDFCFIFPNKRSATFFTDFLSIETKKQRKTEAIIHPACLTIVDFVESFSKSVPADRLELIFLLYEAYSGIIRKNHNEAVDFNKFVYWADVLLNDFDDVDVSLADPAEIFRNVETFKEISANYLTSEQREVLSHYFREGDLPPEIPEFWNHIKYPSDRNDNSALSSGFIRLWMVMREIYDEFQRVLKTRNLHTAGMAYRNAVDELSTATASELPYARYIFVGFNSLSKAEKAIFSRLKELRNQEIGEPFADFYWDSASPVLRDNRFAMSRIIQYYQKEYPSFYDCVEPVETFPKINIIGVPSRVGQTKVIGQILNRIFPTETPVDENALKKTAVVLPEEGMLTPLLNALPDQVQTLNITMGYKLRNTSVSGLVKSIVSMQMRAYKSSVENTFFRDDVIEILSHPLIRSYKHLECTTLIDTIEQRRLFQIPESFFITSDYDFMPVFKMVGNKNDRQEVFDYLLNLMRWLTVAVKSWLPHKDVEAYEIDDNVNRDDVPQKVVESLDVARSVAIQEAFIRRYTSAVIKLRTLCDKYLKHDDIFVESSTVFNMVERIVQGEMLNFEGVPLKGLQIMGVLEARSLDFDTLIIPSMNERIFPRARFTASFIPMVIRNAYGLPTPDDQENAYAYFFYRMISRLRSAYLLYDARTSGIKSRQMSRYINQLVNIIKPEGMHKEVIPYAMISPEKPEFTVAKTPEIMARINRYRSEDNPKYLSASSIKLLVGCPMAFYFEKIMGYRREDPVTEWIDESTYGTIVHEVFEHLYGDRIQNPDNGLLVTSDLLDEMRDNVTEIDRQITMAVNRNYHKLGDDCETPLSGDARIIGTIIRDIVKMMFSREKAHAPFIYMHGEWAESKPLLLKGSNGKEMTVNFTCRIDRVDRYMGDQDFPRLRIIDYKTGADKTEAVSAEQVFTKFDQKAFLQLMLYCEAYSQFEGYKDAIQPMVFQTRKIMVNDIADLKLWAPKDGDNVEFHDKKRPARAGGKWKLLDYRDYIEEINDILIGYLESLFNPDEPFRCAHDDEPCRLCAFTSICQKNVKH